MSVKITVPDKEFVEEAEQIIGQLARDRYNERRLEIGEEFVQICTPFVPWDTGTLASSGHAYISGQDDLRVIWSRSKKGKDIASMQYYNRNYQHTGDRTDHWDKAAMEYESDTFATRVQEILNRP